MIKGESAAADHARKDPPRSAGSTWLSSPSDAAADGGGDDDDDDDGDAVNATCVISLLHPHPTPPLGGGDTTEN